MMIGSWLHWGKFVARGNYVHMRYYNPRQLPVTSEYLAWLDYHYIIGYTIKCALAAEISNLYVEGVYRDQQQEARASP